MGLPRNAAVFSQAQVLQIVLKCIAMTILLLQTFILLPYITTKNRFVFSTISMVFIYIIGVVIVLARDLYVIDIEQPWPLQTAYVLFAVSMQLYEWLSYFRIQSIECYQRELKVIKGWLILESLATVVVLVLIIIPDFDNSTALYMLMAVVSSQTIKTVLTNIIFLKCYILPLFGKQNPDLNAKNLLIVYVVVDVLLHSVYLIGFASNSNYLTSLMNVCTAFQYGLYLAITFKMYSFRDEEDTQSLPSSIKSPIERRTMAESMVSDALYPSHLQSTSERYTILTEESRPIDDEDSNRQSTMTTSTHAEERYSSITGIYSQYTESIVQYIDEGSVQYVNRSDPRYTEVSDSMFSQSSSALQSESEIIDSIIVSEGSNNSMLNTTTQQDLSKPTVITNQAKSTQNDKIFSPSTRSPQDMESIVIFSPQKQINLKNKSVAESVNTEYLANKYGSILENFSPQ